MAKPISTKEGFKKKTVEDMKILNVYTPEYEPLIDIYSGLLYEYYLADKKHQNNNYQLESDTAAGGTKKSAITAAKENLRKDILSYSDRLCLNPKSSSVEPPKQREKPANVFAQFMEVNKR